MFIPSYGGPVIRALTEASRGFLEKPPPEIGGALIKPRQVLHFGSRAGDSLFGDVRPLTAAETLRLCPLLRQDVVDEAWLEHGAGELDVSRLHHGLIAMATRRGAKVWLGADVSIAGRTTDGWRLRVGAETLSCRVLINAAGAWADQIAAQAGLGSVGLRSYQRTVVLVEAPEPALQPLQHLIVKQAGERLYFRPFGRQLLVSPADATPAPPGDVAPEPGDVALAMARLEEATTLAPRHVSHKWAGLRTFAADHLPVVGWDRRAPGFFWMAGLGGFGFQTAPALGRLAAAILRNEPAQLSGLPAPDTLFDPNRRLEIISASGLG
jgi:D-arginine dehydrogenase